MASRGSEGPTGVLGDVEARVLDLVRRHGWNATSFQVLQPGFRYFFVDDDACVAYVDTGRAWVAAGAPLAPPARLQVVAAAFVAAAGAAQRRACFFGTEERFAMAAGLQSMLIGEQAIREPAGWAATLAAARSLREQLRRARAKGITVRVATAAELVDADAPVHRALATLVRRWLGTREMAPMGFLVDMDPLTVRDDHRVYLAELDGRLVGFLAASPIFARRGWLIQALVRAPDAPNGTNELLVDEAMRAAAADEDAVVTLGLAPLAGRVAPPLRWARSAGAVLFDFEGLRAFKAKLRPARWDPIYLSRPDGQGAFVSILDVLAAFARGRPLRFGIETLLRGPAVVVRVLALALFPWTVGLALADARWFPHPAVKGAWVAFDVVMAGGLLALARRWRDWLSRVLLFAVGADVVLTTLEAATWNARRVRGALDVTLLFAAVIAPLVAFIVLWRARVRRRPHGDGLRPDRKG